MNYFLIRIIFGGNKDYSFEKIGDTNVYTIQSLMREENEVVRFMEWYIKSSLSKLFGHKMNYLALPHYGLKPQKSFLFRMIEGKGKNYIEIVRGINVYNMYIGRIAEDSIVKYVSRKFKKDVFN